MTKNSLPSRTLTCFLPIIESYDIKIEDGLRYPVADRDVPGFEEFTVCFWLQLVDNWKAPTGSNGVRLIWATMWTDDLETTGHLRNDYNLKGTADSIYLEYTGRRIRAL